MMRYFRALWYACTGRFSAAAEALQSNKYVMSATYDKSIDKSRDRFQTVKDAVAQLMGIEQTRIQEIKELQSREDKLERVKKGAHAAMQRAINSLKDAGKDKTGIQADPEFQKHHAAYTDASSSVAEVSARIDEKEADLADRRKQIAQYKIQLTQMQKDVKELAEEKHEALADVAVAQQADAINSVLAGIANDTTDKDLQAAREARKKAKASAQISTELAGTDAVVAENEYLELAGSAAADSELDSLLNWGDEDAADTKADAKLLE
jgi:phage shock protein A